MRGSILVMGLLLSACSGGAVGRTLSLCELGHAAERAGKGILVDASRALSASERRTFTFDEVWVGQAGAVEFSADKSVSLSGYQGGAMVLITWSTASGTNDVGGQGLFWEIAPGAFRNSAAYAGSKIDDGGTLGTVTEDELRAEVLRGAAASAVDACAR